MIEDQQSLEEALFEMAEQKSSPSDRAAFLDGVCRDNPALRARLDVLLEGHFRAAKFLTQKANPPTSSEMAAELALKSADFRANEEPAQTIGRYKLLEKIGEGGFGEVWMTEQREPVKRRVALKIIKLGMDTRQIVARFEAERQALALMDHPNIAKVLDAGATDTGRPYFVMELVRGSKITEYCDKNALPMRERLKLFILVCQAIQHAHQKGIIHRDIKPSNVLVTLHDGVPVPKVIDFGIAKATQGELTDKTLFTQFQQFIGTPAYISPEQAETSGLDIDTRSDIYSLGVLLYELLVGQTPFDAKEMMKGGLDALRQLIREKEPVKPSTRFKTLPAVELTTTAQRRQTDAVKLTHLIRGDLDWIVMKCLEKDRARRYETANGLALDLQRYLANEPVAARPPSALYRVQKTVRRNRLAFAAGALILLVLLSGVGVVIFVQHRANQEYRERLYVSELNLAGTAWQAGQTAQMVALLDRCPPALRHWEWDFLQRQANRWNETVILTATNLVGAMLSADGRLAAIAAGDVIQIRDFPSGQWLLDIPFSVQWYSYFVVSTRDDYLATLDRRDGAISVWSMRAGERVATMKHGGFVDALGWSADSQELASGGNDSTIHLWNPETGRHLRSFSTTAPVHALAFSPDNKTLAVGTAASSVQLLDISSGAVKRSFQTHEGVVNLLKFSPDGRNLAVGSSSPEGGARDFRLWSLEEEGSLELGNTANAVSFSTDGRQLLVRDDTGTLHLWNLNRRSELDRFSARAQWAELLPDGRVFSGARDGKLSIWQTGPSSLQQLKGYPNVLRTLAFTPESQWLLAAGMDRQVFVWNARDNQLAGIYTNHLASAFAVASGPDGRVATTSFDRMVQVWDPASRRMLWQTSLAPARDAYWLVYSPDARKLYIASHRGTVTVLDATTGKRLNAINDLGGDNILDGLAISRDGRLLAICQKVKLSVWSTDGLRKLWESPANPERCAAFSPDGKWLATGDQDGTVSLWNVPASGRVRRILSGHTASVSGVSFHPDGSRLVSCSFDGQVKVWELKSGAELLTLPLPGGVKAWHALFSPDGKTIAAAGADGIVTLWKTE